jgi:hypothetical protein
VTYPVAPADVAARWRALDDDETAVAAVLIDDLCSDLDLLRPSLAATYADATDPELTVLRKTIVRTIAEATKRALRNPDTLSSTNLSADGGIAVGYDNRIEDLKSTGAFLTNDDLGMIDRAVAAVTGDVYSSVNSVQLVANPYYCPPGDLTILPTP